MTLVESLDDVVTEIVDDLYLAHFGQERDEPAAGPAAALELARAVVANPSAELRPVDPPPGTDAAVRVELREDVWRSWSAASAAAASSATTIYSAGWPLRWSPTIRLPAGACTGAGRS